MLNLWFLESAFARVMIFTELRSTAFILSKYLNEHISKFLPDLQHVRSNFVVGANAVDSFALEVNEQELVIEGI